MLRYNFLASVVCDINLKLSRNKGVQKQHNIVFHYCLSEIMPLDLRTSQLTSTRSVDAAPLGELPNHTNFTKKCHETEPLKY